MADRTRKLRVLRTLLVLALVGTCADWSRLTGTCFPNAKAAAGPVITSLAVNGKKLEVSGDGFVQKSKVVINGVRQKTSFGSPTRLVCPKAGKKLRERDTVWVENPDGSRSPDLAYISEPYSVAVNAIDLVYVSSRNRVYASVASGNSTEPDSIAVIDAQFARVETSIPVGRGAGRLALSEDERYLYIVIEGPAIQRLNLLTNTIDLHFPLGLDASTVALRVTDLRTVPGRSESVAVSIAFRDYTGHGGVAVYDNGLRRPLVSPGNAASTRICFGTSPDTLWGYNQVHDGFDLWKLRVDDQGVTVVGNYGRGLVFGFGRHFVLFDGRLFTGDGRVIDPEARAYAGRFYIYDVLYSSTLAIAPEQRRAYFAVREGYGMSLSSFDVDTYRLVSYSSGPTYGVAWTPSRMMWCGPAGLGVISEASERQHIVFFPPSFFKPLDSYQRPQPVPINNGVRRIGLPHYDLIYDDRNRLFYASTPGVAGDIGNSLVKIDPFAGTVGDSVWVGSEPFTMTLSDGGDYLYLGIQGANAVSRFNLPQLTFDQRFRVFTDDEGGPYSSLASGAVQMLPVRRHPESVIVLRPGGGGLVVYDNGVRRPQSTPGFDSNNGPINIVQLSTSGDTIFGLETESTAFKFFNVSLAADGVRVTAKAWEVGNSFYSDMKCEADQCFTSLGLIVDPLRLARVGQFGFVTPPSDQLISRLVVPDTANGRVFFISSRERDGIVIQANDLSTWLPIASFKVPDVKGPVYNFLKWNGDQLAFSTGEEIVLLPISLLKPLP
jgi:DNA-binding beta-propeller fold protein YncE